MRGFKSNKDIYGNNAQENCRNYGHEMPVLCGADGWLKEHSDQSDTYHDVYESDSGQPCLVSHRTVRVKT